MNVYLTGGAIRDILTGFPIRDLDFTIQGNPLKLRHDIETSGAVVDMVDETFCVLHAVFSGSRAEISMARGELFDKPGKPPLVTPATINEDLRRRDFTFNAMALSLNDGSLGLLLDPFNGAADIEARLIRILHSYAFLEDPSRLIRATRFAARFGWEMEERTRTRYDSAREGEYIQFINERAIGYEIEQIAHEENPIAVMQALESEGWLKVLCPEWTAAKADVPELAQLLRTRTVMAELNIGVDAAPAVMRFITSKLSDAEIAQIQQIIPHREFVAAWKQLEDDARELSKKLLSKEAAQNSGTWNILSTAKPEALLFLDATGRNKAVDEKIKKFFGEWRQLKDKLPFAEMAELRITPQHPEYSRICHDAFMLLLDGKLRTQGEIMKFLAPFEPPPPPPPPMPARRGRSAVKKIAAPSGVKSAEERPAVAVAPAVQTEMTPAKTAQRPEKTKLVSKKVPPREKKTVVAKTRATAAKNTSPKSARAVVKTAQAKPKTTQKKNLAKKVAPRPAVRATAVGQVAKATKVAKAAGKTSVRKAPDKNFGHPKKHLKR